MIVQILLATSLIVVVLLQGRGSGLGSVFGGDTLGVYKARRGVEKVLFWATIGISIVLAVIAILTVLIGG